MIWCYLSGTPSCPAAGGVWGEARAIPANDHPACHPIGQGHSSDRWVCHIEDREEIRGASTVRSQRIVQWQQLSLSVDFCSVTECWPNGGFVEICRWSSMLWIVWWSDNLIIHFSKNIIFFRFIQRKLLSWSFIYKWMDVAGIRWIEVWFVVTGSRSRTDRYADDWKRHQGGDVGHAAELPSGAILDVYFGKNMRSKEFQQTLS